MRCRAKFPAKKGILVDLVFFGCAPGFHKIRYISWVNDGIAGKFILQLTNMMSTSARGHLKVNKNWIFLKYVPGVLKTSAEISPEIRAGAQRQAVLLPGLAFLFLGSSPSRLVWLDTTGARLIFQVYAGCVPLNPRG